MPRTGSRLRWRDRAVWLGAALLAAAVASVLAFAPTWAALDGKLFDVFTTDAAPGATRAPVVILGVDQPTLQELQQSWPLPRRLHAQLLARLRADGARAVGFDFVMAEPSSAADDDAFASAIAAGPPTVLGSSRERLESAAATLWTRAEPLAAFTGAGARAGDIGLEPDGDFVVRRPPAGEDSFVQQLLVAARSPHAQDAPAPLLAYAGPRGTVDTRSYYQAVQPGLLPAGFFRDRIVLVGRASGSVVESQLARGTTFNSPFALTRDEALFPAVEIHATALANRLEGRGIRPVPPAVTWLAVALLAAGILAATAWLHPLSAAAVALAALAGVPALAWGMFRGAHLWLPPVVPMLVLLATYVCATLASVWAARRRAQQVRGMFAQYVPQAVVEQLVRRPDLLQLGGEAREVTVMFTDLANFTGLAERLSPQQTVELLTDYFNAMTPVIHRHLGTVDKFIGDAVMAFWGAPLDDPSHAEHAVRAALEMQSAMPALADRLLERGLPPVAMRIGIHTGVAVVGNVGSDTRFSYTAVGDAVNLAARLEGANKAFASAILVSDTTARRLPADLPLRPLDDVVVKGRAEALRVHTPCDDPAVRRRSVAALDAMAVANWTSARDHLLALLALRPGDPAAQRLLQRVDVASTSTSARAEPVALDKL